MKMITSVDHPMVKHTAKLRLNRDYRYEHESLVIPGIKLATEVAAVFPIRTVFVYDKTFLPPGIKGEIYQVNESIMKKVSGMVNPEGLLVVAEMPKPANLSKLKTVLVFDGVSDPGNMGALLRTALALGWEGAYIVDNSCDPYNDKALRAARGATFHLPLKMGNWHELQALAKAAGWTPLVADLTGTAPENLPNSKKVMLVMSNEAHGISPEAAALCTKVSIPMSGKIDSLNVSVAGGILMYTLRTS
jgi:RNA methyltransferase, TrmH family